MMTPDEIRELWNETYDGLMLLHEELFKLERFGEYRTPEEKAEFQLMATLLDRTTPTLVAEWEQGLPY